LRAYESHGAIDYHLGRIDPAVQYLGIPLLAFGKLGTAERILPTQVIPIVDMEGKREDAIAGALRFVREAGQQGVGGGTAGTAFGGEKLDQGEWLGMGGGC
jgi:hypothetical protein